MGIFTSKKDTKTAAPKAEKALAKQAAAPVISAAAHHLISRVRVTEKSAYGSENGVYVFDVEASATKPQIALAVEALYKAKPVAVNIVNIPRKKVFIRGKRGMKAGVKKAYVTLAKGAKIEII